MREDRLEQIFEQIAQADVAVPPVGHVLARGRQRRRHARLIVAAALVLAAGAALGARQLAGAATGERPSTKLTSQGPHALPPPGSGPLLLGLNGSGRFVMTRIGSAGPPVPVPGLAAITGELSPLATNPAGGWVVAYTTDQGAPAGFQPVRLALVAVTGDSDPFGPVLRQSSVTSIAVSPDGARVALAFAGQSSTSSGIEVLPVPGHRGSARTWRFGPLASGDAVSLSWAPDGRRLSYVSGFQTGGGLQGELETLDTAAGGSTAPGMTLYANNGPGSACAPDAVAWLGARLVALQECGDAVTGSGVEILVPVDPRTGAPTGTKQLVARQVGCPEPGLAPSPGGVRVLVSYCGLMLDDRGSLTRLPAWLFAAAFAG